MLLILLAFLMKFVDITKLQQPQQQQQHQQPSQRQSHGADNVALVGGNNVAWQHVALRNKTDNSNSSSTSSGCDSNASSTKENRSYTERNHAITPQQLQQIRHYQRLQQQQLQLLQQQLLQRRRLQQQLRDEGVLMGGAQRKPSSTAATLTCNQEYLRQQRKQQEQQQRYKPSQNDNNRNRVPQNFNKQYLFNLQSDSNNQASYNYKNDNNNNNNGDDYNYCGLMLRGGFVQGQNSRRGMTEFSTNNDIKSHHSQSLLHNSPHHQPRNQRNSYQLQQPKQQQHHNSPQHNPHQVLSHHNQNYHNSQNHSNHYHHHPPPSSPQHQLANINNHLAYKQTTHNHKNNQQTLPLNSSANTNNHCTSIETSPISTTTALPTPTSATQQSPLQYKKPLNSPNNSPFAYAYYGANNHHHHQHQQQQQHLQKQQQAQLALQSPQYLATTTAQQQQQQQLRLLHNKLSQTNYQQHLNDLFLQQQHLQQQQQQLLSAAGASRKDENGVCIGGSDELSDECLKQNVAIVLNNLDRYNNALRSIILNEQVSNSLFDDSLLDFSSISNSNSNNNFLLSNNSNCSSKMATAATPESDYNSNATTPGSRVGSNMFPTQQHLLLQQQQHDNVVGYTTQTTGGGVGGGGGWETGGVGFCSNNVGAGGGASNNLNCSFASSHDFTHDNSDYQWFLDYGYRDGCSMQRSVLSSLSASYNGIGELLYYEDLAKNIDANLAEVDMESFRAEDIHSLLSQLPSYCKGIGGGANGRLQQSLMQQHMLPAHNVSQTSNSSTNELIDNSICKSELLFSPVKESHISVDSLDMDAYPDDGDIILTCKANKDNYTIAFEGSVLYSDESFYEPSEISLKNKQNFINLHSNLDDIVKRKSLEVSMSRSEHQLTTWSKLKKGNALQRYPSGNNNTAENVVPLLHAPHCTVRKSSSLPNLRCKKDSTACNRQQLNVSHVSTTTLESCRSRNLLPMCQMPISCSSTTASTSERLVHNSQQQQHQQYQKHQLHLQLQNNQQQPRQQAHHHHHHHNHHRNQHNHSNHQHLQHGNTSCCSITSASSAMLQKQSSGNGNTSSGTSAASSNQPAFNLVKLFIKQKSCSSSSEEHASAQTCMDVSSGCWPSSDAAGSSGSSSSLEQRLRKKSMNDSGKGSALSRHDEEDLRQGAVVGDSYLVDNINVEHAETLCEHARQHNEVFYEEDRTLTASPTSTKELRRRSLPLRHPQVCHLAQQHQHNNNGSSAGSLHSSDASRSNSEQLTQVYLSSDEAGGVVQERKKDNLRHREVNKANQHASANSEMITRSMQTSCGSLSTRSSINDRFRFVPPSFLAKLNNLGEEKQAPIYVIYPNYALPDLGFVKTNNTTDVIFSPFNFQMALTGNGGGSVAAVPKQPHYSEDEILKNIDHKHVVDWKSLATLLPAEYRKRLQHIPEVGNLNLEQGGDITSQKPLFCMTPPIRRPQRSAQLCDCAQYFQQTAQTQQQQHQEGSSSSGSSQQPSSGYRGSSTLLTDSELGDTAPGATPVVTDPLKQMYVYQYEQQQQQHQRNDSGIDSPAAKPIPHPRGILRKASSQGGVERNKRNSMFEEKRTKLTKQEKRRSLQEPAYQQNFAGGGSMDELYAVLPEEEVFEEQLVEAYFAGMLQTNQRLSRKDMDARARAENFLSSLPRSELKYYAEIAAILESSEDQQQAAADQYDAAALKKEVSRALSQQKKVSFNENEQQQQVAQQQQQQHQHQLFQAEARHKRFSTPPNSPNISIAGGLRMPSSGAIARRCSPLDTQAARRSAGVIDSKEQQKINSNRFKRLQIQWELLSKDSSMMLKDLACEQETKSGGSTPTTAQAVAAAAAAAAAQRSRIPRPVSYPAGKRSLEPVKSVEKKGFARIIKPVVPSQITRITSQDDTKTPTSTRSPSRIVPPKRYSITSPSAATAATTLGNATATTPTTRARTPTSRPMTAPVTAPNTPKRRVQSPRTIPRVR